MMPLVFSLALLAWLSWFIGRRPHAMLALAFLLVTFASRTVSILFLDLFGPALSTEIGRNVGGNGALPLYVVSMTALFVPAVLCLGKAPAMQRGGVGTMSPGSSATIATAVFWLGSAFCLALYVDMLRIGVVPLLVGMERFEYAAQYAGALHKWFFDQGNLVMFCMGVVATLPAVGGGGIDRRMVWLLVAFFFYCFLTGHRFSAFYSFGSFFVMPMAAIPFAQGRQEHEVGAGNTAPQVPPVRRRIALKVMLVGGIAVGLVGFALVNSYTRVRAADAGLAAFSFMQRVLVQPGELWAESYENVVLQGDYRPGYAYRMQFTSDALDPQRNTGIQFLMARAIGEARTSDTLAQGFQFTGGFPDVVLELTGPYGLLPAMVAIGIALGLLLRVILASVRQSMVGTAFLAAYVLYGVLLLVNSGMANFFLAWTYWLKCLALAGALALQRLGKLDVGRNRALRDGFAR